MNLGRRALLVSFGAFALLPTRSWGRARLLDALAAQKLPSDIVQRVHVAPELLAMAPAHLDDATLERLRVRFPAAMRTCEEQLRIALYSPG